MPKRTYPNLVKYLDETGDTQWNLARRVGVSQSYMSKIVRGLAEPPLELALRISHTAGVPLESLVRAAYRSEAGNSCV
jgi:transcriptional regulator with XRE-family HTH domain